MKGEQGGLLGLCSLHWGPVPLLGECVLDSYCNVKFFECMSCGIVDVFVLDRFHDWEWFGRVRGIPERKTYRLEKRVPDFTPELVDKSVEEIQKLHLAARRPFGGPG